MAITIAFSGCDLHVVCVIHALLPIAFKAALVSWPMVAVVLFQRLHGHAEKARRVPRLHVPLHKPSRRRVTMPVWRTATDSVPDTIAKWRWIYTHCKATGGGNFELTIINLTDDSSTNAPTPTTFTGRSLGVHKTALDTRSASTQSRRSLYPSEIFGYHPLRHLARCGLGRSPSCCGLAFRIRA